MFFRTWLLFQEFFNDLTAQKTRAFLTTFAVAWGTLSVIVLLAFGEGLQKQMLTGQLNNGDKIIRIFGGSTSIVYQGLPKGRSIDLRPEDADLIRTSIPEVDLVSPCYGTRQPVEYKDRNTTDCYMVGVDPVFEDLRRMFPVAGGRFVNVEDVEQRRRVVFLGHEIALRLFQDENPIGKQMKIAGYPFTVIGTMPKKFQNSMSNGPDDRRVVIPYTTFHTLWPRRDIWYLGVRPRVASENMFVRARLLEVLGKKYRFDGEDKRALWFWDSIENEADMRRVFKGIQIFMAAVGGMTLLIAGVGVANIMYVVVKERTREIGIKRAIGAKRRHIVSQFILESILVTSVGGFIGTAISLILISIIQVLPLEQNRSLEFLGKPHFSSDIALFTVAVLTTIGLLAGLYPARRASLIEPVEALRYE